MDITLSELTGQYYRLFNDVYIHAFSYMVMVDILTGLLKAGKQHKLNSTVGLWGLVKHVTVMLVVISVYPYLLYIKFNGIAYIIVTYFVVTYAISIIENLSVLGIPFPNGIKRKLEKIQKELDDKEE